MYGINNTIYEHSDSEDGDSIPGSSIPSYTNSLRNSPSGSRAASPNLFQSINKPNVENRKEEHALRDLQTGSNGDASKGYRPENYPGERSDDISEAPPIVFLNKLAFDENTSPGVSRGTDSFVDPADGGSSDQLKKISKEISNNGGCAGNNGNIVVVQSTITPPPNVVTDDAEPGYFGRVKLGCFACKRRTREDYSKANRECSSLCSYLTQTRKRLCSLQSWKDYLMDRFPCCKWIPYYRLKHLRGDIAAGLTTGFSIIPQGLAYGQIVEIAAQYGLYSSVMGSYAYAVLGTSRHVAVGPSAVLSIVSAEYATGRSPVPNDHTYASILAFFTGFILLGMGLFKLGFLFTFISMPVWKAFRAAAGVVIFASRIKKWWGLKGVPRQFIPQMVQTLRRMKETNLLDLFFGAMFIILLVLFKKLKAHKWKQRFRNMNWKWKIVKKFFWFLGAERNILVVALGSAIVYGLLQNGWNISHTSDIPRGIPFPAIPAFSLRVNENITVGLSEIVQTIGVGFFFAPMVAMYETLNVGNTYGRKTNYRVDYDQELIAIGVSNVLSSLLRGHPICGAYLRSGINFGAQVRTPAGGILAATVLIILTYIANHLFYLIPVSAMAATIMMGAVDVCTFHKFGFLWTINKVEILSWSTTFIASLVIGIEYGVLVGILTDWLIYLMIVRSSQYQKTEVIENGKLRIVLTIKNKVGLLAPSIHNISLQIEKEIFYSGNCIEKVCLNLRDVYNIDSTSINWLIYLQVRCKKSNKVFEIINAQDCVLKMITKSDARISLK